MAILKNLRGFFWPSLEPEPPEEPSFLEEEGLKLNTDHQKDLLKYVLEYYNSENDRKKTVETKSSLFISIISVVTTIVLGVTTVLVKTSDFNFWLLILVGLLVLLTIYMSRTIWFSLKALERKTYHTVSPEDFLSAPADNYYAHLVVRITNKTRRNSVTINEKVDSMVLAQEYFKRAIVTTSIYSISVMGVFIVNTDFTLSLPYESFFKLLDTLSLSTLNTVLIYILLVASLIIGIANWRRK